MEGGKKMSKKTIHSGFDTRGYLYVACTECIRGWNGDKSCSAGWNVKQYRGQICFSGEPLPEIKEILFKKQDEVKK